MKSNKFVLLILITLSILTLVACNKETDNPDSSDVIIDTKSDQSYEEEKEETKQGIESKDESGNTNETRSKDLIIESETEESNVNESIDEDNTVIPSTKIKGRQEFIEKLDKIQEELDSLDIKKDSDAGVTSAMRGFYGISYDKYDEALNEIYTMFKEELPEEIMNDLQNEQLKWIEQKEDKAMKETEEFKGGTFEFVAYNMSLYESTKDRCYELVNQYMED